MEPITWGNALAWALTSIGGAFVGSYLGAYMKKKGQDRAIKEGFDEVLRQARETTAVTKGIEAKISDTVWDRQKRWELKRDVLFDAVKKMAQLEEKLNYMRDLVQLEFDNPAKDRKDRLIQQRDAIDAFDAARMNLDETLLLASMCCSKKTTQQLEGFASLILHISTEVANGTWDIPMASHTAVTKSRLEAREAIRQELGIESWYPAAQSGKS